MSNELRKFICSPPTMVKICLQKAYICSI
uniref:Uncharacterized protein n=1 Tax=Anguilla anguilla TaxID=7936 RepID=A0A0E9VHI0_ANGAN